MRIAEPEIREIGQSIPRISPAVARGDPSAAAQPSRNDSARRRLSGLEIGSLCFLVAIAIVGAGSAGSLLAAGFALLAPPKAAPRSAVSDAGRAPTAAPRAPLSNAGRIKPPAHRAPAATPVPLMERAELLPPEPPPQHVAGPPSPANPAHAAASFAMSQGDTAFGNGEVSVARYYYERAVDAGEAAAAVQMGETFDPAFLTHGRLRRVRGDPAAARFWYRRALDLGAADAQQRLNYLDTEPAVNRSTERARWGAYRHRAWEYRRYERSTPPGVTLQEIIEHILHPFPRG
jgi:TPR repeat protein